jgi:Family of unknown function (DUF5709)
MSAEPSSELSFDYFAEDDGVLEPGDSLDGDPRVNVLDTGVDAGEGYRGANRYGTTAEEARAGETLDLLLSEEEPDIGIDGDAEWGDEDDPRDDDRVAQARAGRLMAPDQGSQAIDEADLVAYDAGIDGAGASAEEAAVHLTDDPPWT